jgi:hypothetical protein
MKENNMGVGDAGITITSSSGNVTTSTIVGSRKLYKDGQVPKPNTIISGTEETNNNNNNIQNKEIHTDHTHTHVHTHAIPNNVIFTHYVDLLHTPVTDFDPDSEDVVLKANVEHTISLHPGATVYFYTDDKCIIAIQQALGVGNSIPLVDYFLKETQGMYKADICRGAALYNVGGLYFDVDLQARMNVFGAIHPPSTEFVTPTVHSKSNWPGAFFQAFIGVTRHHPLMMRYLELFLKHYNGIAGLEGSSKSDVVEKGPLGVILLRRAYDELHHEQEQHEEHENEALSQSENVVAKSVLWEETRYHKDRFPDVEAPHGKRRACHFLVAIPHTPTAVFYSRVRGSRMCGGTESIK